MLHSLLLLLTMNIVLSAAQGQGHDGKCHRDAGR